MSFEQAMERPKIGFWWGEKKCRELSTEDFVNACRKLGYELVKLDLSRPFEEQGPFVAIVHKICDLLIKADSGDWAAKNVIENLERYCALHPEMVVLDSPDCVRRVLNRYRQYKLVEESVLSSVDWMYIPPFVELPTDDVNDNIRRLRQGQVYYPILCKYMVSHASSKAHEMALVFSDGGLSHIPTPCVAQQFVHHNATLYKLYAINDKYHVIRRPSLQNFVADANRSTECFNSHDVSKPHSTSHLIDVTRWQNAPEPPRDRLDFIVRVMRSVLGQTLFGVDVIVEEGTGRLCVIDVNNFPGYDGVSDFLDRLATLVDAMVRERALAVKKSAAADLSLTTAGNPPKTAPASNNGDSGIDDSASCSDSSIKS